MIDPRSRRERSVEVIDVQVAPPTDGADAALLRVAGRWTRGRPHGPTAPVLVVGTERFEALSGFEERGSDTDPRWQATFTVPERLRSALSEPIALEIGSARIGLPPVPVVPSEPADEAAAGAEPPEDLSEHRARRAEVAEQAQARRAAEAEQTLSALEAERARLALGLEQAAKDRTSLEGELAERERELRAARQRAYAEQRLRQEASDEAAQRADSAQEEVLEVRRRLDRAERRARESASELEGLRRRAAEAQQQVGAADAARRAAETRVAELEAAAERGLDGVREAGEQVADARGQVADAIETAQAVQAEAQALVREAEAARERARSDAPGPGSSSSLDEQLLSEEAGMPGLGHDRRTEALAAAEQQVGEAREIVASVQEQLDEERAATAQEIDRRLDAQREELEARTSNVEARAIALEQELREARADRAVLQGEVAERTSAQTRIDNELVGLREEVERLRLEAEAQARERAAAERVVGELTSSAEAVRTQLAALDSERRTAATMTQQAQELLERSRSELEALRAELKQRTEAQRSLERERDRDRSTFAREREGDRATFERERAQDRAGFERERAEFERKLVQAADRARTEAQRELAPLRQRASELRDRLEQATTGLRTRLDAERSARREAEAGLAEQAERAQKLEAELEERTVMQRRIEGALEGLRHQLGAVVADEERTRATGGAVLELVGQASEALAEAEQRIGEVQIAAREVQAELERERVERAASEAALREAAERQRSAFEGQIEELRERMAALEREEFAASEDGPAEPPESEPEPDVLEPPSFASAEQKVEDLLSGLRDRLGALEQRAEAELGPEAMGPPPAEPAEPEAPDAEPPEASAPDASEPEVAEPDTVAPPPATPDTPEPSEPEPEPEPEPEAEPAAPEPSAVEPEAEPPAPAAPPAPASPAFAAPGAGPRPRQRAGPPVTDPLAALGRGVAVGAARTGSWLAPALEALALSDAAAAAQLAVELVPVQAAAQNLELDADIVLLGVGAWRVVAGSDGSASAPLTDLRPRREVDFRLTTEPAAFVAFVTGRRRVRGKPKIRVQGGRRAGRRLRGLASAPVGLVEALKAGAPVDVERAWGAVATAIDAGWTAGERFTVAHEPTDTPPFYVHVDDGRPVTVDADPGPEPPVATVKGSHRALLALLAGLAPAEGDMASIAGDLEALEALETWAVRAQDPATASV